MNRIDWIKEVRPILSDFACEYIKKERRDINRMMELATRAEFYMRRGEPSYDALISQMERCCKTSYTEQDYRRLILCSQYVLNRTWKRLVLEGKGTLPETEEEMNCIVDEQTRELAQQMESSERMDQGNNTGERV